MSSDADAAAETVALYSIFYTSGYCNLAAAVLFIYDTCLTFDREVAYFWTAKRIGGPSLLFFANKWISMTIYIMALVEFATFPSDKSCSMFVIAAQAMAILQFMPGAAFSALRAYGLSSSKTLGLLVAALSLVPVGANLVPYAFQYSGVVVPPFGCIVTDNTTAGLDLKFHFYAMTHTHPRNRTVIIVSRVPLIVADMILIYSTWTKLRGSAALTDIRQSNRLTLSDILFRGGMSLSAVYAHCTVVVNPNQEGSEVTDNITFFTAPITAILISRFLLALQEANRMDVRVGPDDPPLDSRDPYNTTSFISTLGGFVNPALSAWSDDEDGIELHVRSASEASEEEKDSAQTEGPEATVSSSSIA
ncbi:hypothetical protein K466DRAFT_588699 [Polyporus arcularius HHB13444]|uniref:DUF6533 domain-containing protein n=1 Tax=Polyporus arcularius HHB13444 TaxID=1314778 RepID=A0A5C3P743_9APHY|nr:hypothetical protein K466DRAFT_588699 [Polyporus arcularius HHB13444]